MIKIIFSLKNCRIPTGKPVAFLSKSKRGGGAQQWTFGGISGLAIPSTAKRVMMFAAQDSQSDIPKVHSLQESQTGFLLMGHSCSIQTNSGTSVDGFISKSSQSSATLFQIGGTGNCEMYLRVSDGEYFTPIKHRVVWWVQIVPLDSIINRNEAGSS